MARWEDRLENHKVWETLGTIRQRISKAESKTKGQAGDPWDEVVRLDGLVLFVDQTLNALDPRLVPLSPLNSINKHLATASSHLENFLQNNQVGELQNANNQADNALQQLAQLNVPETASELQGVRKRLTSFRRSAGQLAANMKSDLKAVREEAQKLQRQFEERLTEVESTSKQKRQEIERKYSEQLEQLQATIQQHREEVQSQKKRLESAISEHQSQFSEAQETRRQAFTEEQSKWKESFDSLVTELEEMQADTIEDAKSKIEAAFSRVREVENDVRESAEAIGAIGLTEAFKQTADKQTKAGRFWRGVAALSLVALIVAAVWVFEETAGSTNWISFARRGFVTLSLLILAGYSARQAARHFDSAQKHRQRQVELTSLGPYIATLDADQQAAIKDRLVDRWFGQQWETGEGEAEITGASTTAIRELKELIQEIVKGISGTGT